MNLSVTDNATLTQTMEDGVAADDGLRLGFFTRFDDYSIGTAYILMAVLGVTFNLLAIVTIAKGKRTSGEVKIQLINLAVADMLSAAFVPAYALMSILMLNFPQSVPLCATIRALGFGSFYASPLWNTAISLERVAVVYLPLKMRNYTKKMKLLVAALVWTIGFLPDSIESILYSRVDNMGGAWICYVYPPWLETHRTSYEWVATVKYCLPSLIIVVSYTLIAVKLCSRSRIGERGSVKQESKQAKQKSQVLRMLAIDASVTLVTWLPFNLLYSISGGADSIKHFTTREILILDSLLLGLMMTNVFTSPVIYCIFNKAFRDDAKSLFGFPGDGKGSRPSSTASGYNTSRHTMRTQVSHVSNSLSADCHSNRGSRISVASSDGNNSPVHSSSLNPIIPAVKECQYHDIK